MAETAILNGTPTFVPFTDRSTDMNSFHNTASADQSSQKAARGDASDSTDYTALSEEERSKQQFADKWHAAYDPTSTAATTKPEEKLPHEAIRSKDREEPLSMSWWPIPDDLMVAAEDQFNKGYEVKTTLRPKTQRQPSIFKKLETRLAGFVHGHHNKTAASPGGDIDTETRHTMAEAPAATLKHSTESDSLFHVLLTTSHLEKDINSQVQGVRICGTFASLPAAKAFAHRCLFDAGYEAEWFTTFRTQHDLHLVDHREERIVEATGPGGEVFTVDIATIPNALGLAPASPAARIAAPLFHVVQTIVHYGQDESGQSRDTTVQGSFTDYERAREVAHSLLLWFEDGIDKDTYVQFEEAAPGEPDCGYGENVVVHAVGENGDNYLISILKGEEMEAERVREAALAMRE